MAISRADFNKLVRALRTNPPEELAREYRISAAEAETLVGATLLALFNGRLNYKVLKEVSRSTLNKGIVWGSEQMLHHLRAEVDRRRKRGTLKSYNP